MIASKADRLASAYTELRISGLTVEPNPSDLELALYKLESMMAELQEQRGMHMGYNFENEPDPNSDLGVPQQFWNMIDTNLAVRLIAAFNKEVPGALIAQANQSMSAAAAACARNRIQQVPYPARQPAGSGSRVFNRWARFYNGFQRPAPNAPETLQIMQGDLNDFEESYEAYLRTGEIVTSFTVVCDPGLVVESSFFESPILHYRLSAPVSRNASIWQQVKLKIITDEGREEVRIRNFNVLPNIQVGQQ